MLENTDLIRAAHPEDVGVDSKEFRSFLFDCDRMGLRMHSAMVVRHEQVAAECYWAPYKKEIPHTMFSFSKPITAVAVGFAISEGLLSLDDKVTKFFPDEPVKDPKIAAENEEVTVYYLLTHRSGKNIAITNNCEKNEWLQNWLNAPFKEKPGVKWQYLSENIYMLSRIVSKVSGMTMTEYLTPRLYEPLGISVPYWEKDHNGYDAGGWGAYLTTDDMAKISLCFVNGGKYKGEQIIPEEWIKSSTTKHIATIPSVFNANTGYGFQVFVQTEDKGTFSFNGLYTQFAVMFPKYDAVFICTGGDTQEDLFMRLVWKHFPAVFDDNAVYDENYKDLDKYIAKCAAKEPPLGIRKPETEAFINNRTIRTTGRSTASILGTGNLFMLSARAGEINSFRFNFTDDGLTVDFSEKNSPAATIDVGLNGEYKFSDIELAGLKIPCASYGTWKDNRTFRLTVIPLPMAQYRTFDFHFLPGGFVRVHSHASPGFKELFEFYMMFNGIRPGKALGAILPPAGSLAGAILDPNFYGKMD